MKLKWRIDMKYKVGAGKDYGAMRQVISSGLAWPLKPMFVLVCNLSGLRRMTLYSTRAFHLKPFFVTVAQEEESRRHEHPEGSLVERRVQGSEG
jgi:hypothetical protein